MISIIIPLYNQADKISECLDSILKQSYQDFEVIIVDDASTDNSQEKITKYLNNPRFTFHVSHKNQGAPAARNKGFKESKGEYLFFCDSDAVLIPEALEILLNKLKETPKASYAYSNFLWGKKLFKIGEFTEERLKSAPMIHTMSLIRREAMPKNGWDESIKKLQDWDLYLTILENNHTGVLVNQTLFNIKPGGTISNWLPSFTYKLFPFLPSVKKYKNAVKIIKNKHNLH